MKSLTTLIDLKQRDLDEKRRILVKLQTEMERLAAEEQKLKDLYIHEAKLASDEPEMGRYFGAFADGNQKQQEASRQKQATMNKLVDTQRDAITAAFAELKQLEIAKENKEAEAAAKIKRKEDAALDEIGLRGFISDKP